LALSQSALRPQHSFSNCSSLGHTQGWVLAPQPASTLFASLGF